MYINPVLVGVLGTLFAEAFILIFGALLVYLDTKEKKDGKDNRNQSNQQSFHED